MEKRYGFRGFIATIMIILLSVGLSFGLSKIPDLLNSERIARNQTAPKFDPKVYEGWVYADVALKREGSVLYNHNPHNSESKLLHQNQGYPNSWFPDTFADFGMAVQKPYSGNYVFDMQKGRITKLLDSESAFLAKAQGQFKPINNSKKINANDANVIQALSAYQLVVDKMSSATSSITLEQSKNQELGKYLQDFVGKDTLGKPLGYSVVAQKYLEHNIEKYKSSFIEYSQESGASDDTNIAVVKKYLNIE